MARATTSKERVHDELIAPLIKQLTDICKRNGIAGSMIFDISGPEDPGLSCSTLFGDENNNIPTAWKYRPIAPTEALLRSSMVEDPSGNGLMTTTVLGEK